MRLATSINLVSFNKETGKRIACIESIRRCAAVGFRVFDMNFAPLLDEDYILKFKKFLINNHTLHNMKYHDNKRTALNFN